MSDTQPSGDNEKPQDSKADEKLDDELEDTFPASDAPSQTDPTHGTKIPPGER
jgi:hypothetical protein